MKLEHKNKEAPCTKEVEIQTENEVAQLEPQILRSKSQSNYNSIIDKISGNQNELA